MIIYQNKLCVGDGRHIATLAEDDTWDPTALTLPVGYRVRSLAVYGNRLLIGTWRGANIYDQPEARLFSWELGESAYENIWTLKENGIHALAVWKNLLIVFAGTTGNIYAFNGASLSKIAEVPVISTPGEFVQVFPGSVTEFKGNLLFGISNGTSGTTSSRGIFSLGQKTNAFPLALTSPFIISTGKTTNLVISSIFRADSGILYVGYFDGNSSAYGVQELSISRRIVTGAYWESQIYDIAPEKYSRLVQGVEITAKPLQTSNTIIVKYKLDNAATWSTAGTMTAANQRLMVGIRLVAKTVQLRLEFTTATNNNFSPEIQTIKIY